MKRSFYLVGAVYGFLTALILMAISYLGSILLQLPFLPFDLFDWLARHLPGSIIDFTIQTMVNLISALKLGPIDQVAKLAEQVQGLVLVAVTGIVFGLALAFIQTRAGLGKRSPLLRAGTIGGILLWIGIMVVEVSLPQASVDLVVGLIWLLVLLVLWGRLLASLLDRRAQLAAGLAAEEVSAPGAAAAHMPRRDFLAVAAAGLASAVLLILGLKSYFHPKAGAVANVGGTPGPQGTASSGTLPYGPGYTSGPAASPSQAVLDQRIQPAPGTRDEVTAAENFYRIDINTRPPAVDASSWQLKLGGMVDKPLALTLDDLRSRSAVSQAITLSCISNPLGGDLIGSNFWTGVRLKDILSEAGLQNGATDIAVTSADGYYESVPITEAMDERTLLVYAMNGAPLLAEHGFPLRIFIPNHYGMKQPKWITSMQVQNTPGPSYWVERGWSLSAIPQTTSVIDTQNPDTSAFQSTGIVPLGGIAWAGERGIQKVEVQVDSVDWVPVELRTPALSPLTWVQWRYDWNGTAGAHVVRVRATDGTGALQDSAAHGPGPEGATGIDSASIIV